MYVLRDQVKAGKDFDQEIDDRNSSNQFQQENS